MSYYTGTFLVGAHWFGVPFPKLQAFSRILWVLSIEYSLYKKTILGIFVYLFISKVTTIKVNFLFTNSAVKTQHFLFANEPFLRKMLVLLFTSNIPLYIEKYRVEKLSKVLEMELKTYTPVSPKFVFEKIKFKILHYIQHDFSHQRLGFSKDQARIFKSFVIN